MAEYVIAHGTAKSSTNGNIYLTLEGWQADGRRALRFHSEVDARRYIAEQSTRYPAMFTGHKPTVGAVQTPDARDVGGVVLGPDYDPLSDETPARSVPLADRDVPVYRGNVVPLWRGQR